MIEKISSTQKELRKKYEQKSKARAQEFNMDIISKKWEKLIEEETKKK